MCDPPQPHTRMYLNESSSSFQTFGTNAKALPQIDPDAYNKVLVRFKVDTTIILGCT